MFFETDYCYFRMIDVLELKQKNVRMFNEKRNFYALSYRIRSNAEIKANDATYRMQNDSLSLFPANLDYLRTADYDDLIAVHFDLFDYAADGIETFTVKNHEKFEALFRKILQLRQEQRENYRHECAAVLYQIFVECRTERNDYSDSDDKIKNSVDFMRKNFMKELSLKDIAAQSFVSEVYFRKLFKERYGTSPLKYIVGLRMNYAKELMAAGYYSLKEISRLSGYADYKYFLTEFKRFYGNTPTEYLTRADYDD